MTSCACRRPDCNNQGYPCFETSDFNPKFTPEHERGEIHIRFQSHGINSVAPQEVVNLPLRGFHQSRDAPEGGCNKLYHTRHRVFLRNAPEGGCATFK